MSRIGKKAIAVPAGITANVILPGTMDTPANRRDMPGADTSQWVQPAWIAPVV